ncbi:MAG TPA: aspartate aminotransferase family protein [Acidimicrobiia bacterium]|nr:aspartate aminotransferase family protein [Acidimicrobiia bacterium]
MNFLMVATIGTTQIQQRLDEMIEREEDRFRDRMKRSRQAHERASGVLAGGVTSSWQTSRPQPIWADRASGPHLWDVDGNRYADYHNGYGAMLVGHAHPAIVAAVTERIAEGSHFAQPTSDAVVVAEELARRYGLPLWRFANSGTEATMDAVHLMRAVTGRSMLVKIEGAYHGHHDTVQVSVWNEREELESAIAPRGVLAGTGIPEEILDLTLVVPWNDLEAVEDVFAAYGERIAGMIVEPIMMNAGIIPPVFGYLEGIRRITRDHGALLAFDEVKTGFTVGPGGATQEFGVLPDLVCLAKSLGGGLPTAAVGGTNEVMEAIVSGEYEQVGTFNGNPLSMAAARATLCEVLDDAAYRHLDELRQRIVAGTEATIDQYELPAYSVAIGAKGAITFATEPVRHYRQFLGQGDRHHYAAWLYQFNRGVFLPPWAKGEQWMVSVQHTMEEADLFVETFDAFARDLRA